MLGTISYILIKKRTSVLYHTRHPNCRFATIMNLQIILTILFHTSVQSMDIQTAVVRNLTDSLVHVNSRFNEPVIKLSTGSMTSVDLRVELRNLIDFDVSKGTLTLFATFEWSWTDKSLSWDTSEFNQNFIRLPVHFRDITITFKVFKLLYLTKDH